MIMANEFVAKYLVEKDSNVALLRKTVKNSAWYLPYSQHNNRHESLDLELYTHFTSPLRRYADQLIHRQIFSILNNVKPITPCDETIAMLNLVKNKTKSVDSELKYIELAKNSEHDYTFTANLLYIHDGYARIELPNHENMRLSIPIVSRKIRDIITIREDEDAKINLEYLGSDPLVMEIGEVEIELYWNKNQGLEGFQFNWLYPPIGEWLLNMNIPLEY